MSHYTSPLALVNLHLAPAGLPLWRIHVTDLSAAQPIYGVHLAEESDQYLAGRLVIAASTAERAWQIARNWGEQVVPTMPCILAAQQDLDAIEDAAE